MIEDRFLYAFLPIPFLFLVAIIFILRKDLRRRIIKVGIVGGIAGWVSNIWYFIDYWRPPSLFGQAVFSIEDFLAGFGIAALGVTLYPFITKTPAVKSASFRKLKPLLITIGIWVACFVMFVNILKINSAAVSLSLVALYSIGMIIRYPKLLKQGLIIGGIFVLLGLLDYFFMFGVLSSGYLERYFLLTGEWYNPSLFGFYPLLEVFWYFTWGVFASIFVDYLALRNTKVASKLS